MADTFRNVEPTDGFMVDEDAGFGRSPYDFRRGCIFQLYLLHPLGELLVSCTL